MTTSDTNARMAPEPAGRRRRRLGLAGLLGTMAVLHVAMPEPFERMIPRWVPGDPRTLNLLATAAEGGSAMLLANRRTSRLGGWAALATFLAVYPANVQMAIDGRLPPGMDVDPAIAKAALWGRLPLQFPLFWWSWQVARRGGSASTPGADAA